MSLNGVGGRVSLVFESEDLLAALVEVNIEEDKLFDAWHGKDALQVEVNFLTHVIEVLVGVLGQVCHNCFIIYLYKQQLISHNRFN